MKKLLSYTLLLSLLLGSISCMDDMDDVLPENINMLEANSFVYRALNYFYLYKDDTPELHDDHFNSSKELTDFVYGFERPEDLFSHLKHNKDRFSVLFDDYRELEKRLDGVNYGTGALFSGFEKDGSYYIIVRQVIAQSEAEQNDVKRGDIFYEINGQRITASNVDALITQPIMELKYAYLEEDQITQSQDIVVLSNVELEEPAIGMYNIITNFRGEKVAYLLYNRFTSASISELNQVFSYFKSEGVSDLILDLRYNSGGSVDAAEAMCNLITGQFEGQVMFEDEWNSDRNPQFGKTTKFNNRMKAGGTYSNLELDRVGILTQARTASASELVINALNPYIEVIQVGTATRGKYQGSILLYDSPNFSSQYKNPYHRYAMLPLVLKIKNSIGFTDFDDGLQPTEEVKETVEDIQDNLGSMDEKLVEVTLEYMDLVLAKPAKPSTFNQVATALPSVFDNIMYKELNE